jgi:WD40 repeat protein
LAVGQQSHLITMWDVDTARQLWTRRGTGNWASTPAVFCEDGSKFLKRGSEDVSVLWDAEVGDVLCAVRGPTNTVVLHPNGESLHLGTAEGPEIWPDE